MNKLILMLFALAFLVLLTSCNNTETIDPQDSDFVFYESITDDHILIVEPGNPQWAYSFYPNSSGFLSIPNDNTRIKPIENNLYDIEIAGPNKPSKKTTGLTIMEAGIYQIDSVHTAYSYLDSPDFNVLKGTTVTVELDSIYFSGMNIKTTQNLRIAYSFLYPSYNREDNIYVIYGDKIKQELYIYRSLSFEINGVYEYSKERVTLILSKQ